VALSCNGLKTLIIVAIAILLQGYRAFGKRECRDARLTQFACALIERF
jgi:hypothetical protein